MTEYERWTDLSDREATDEPLTDADRDFLVAECSYDGFRHERTIVFSKAAMLVVALDRVEGPGERSVDQFWHFGADVRQCSPCCLQLGTKALMAFDRQVTLFEGWVSPVFGAKMPAPVAQARGQGRLVVRARRW